MISSGRDTAVMLPPTKGECSLLHPLFIDLPGYELWTFATTEPFKLNKLKYTFKLDSFSSKSTPKCDQKSVFFLGTIFYGRCRRRRCLCSTFSVVIFVNKMTAPTVAITSPQWSLCGMRDAIKRRL